MGQWSETIIVPPKVIRVIFGVWKKYDLPGEGRKSIGGDALPSPVYVEPITEKVKGSNHYNKK